MASVRMVGQNGSVLVCDITLKDATKTTPFGFCLRMPCVNHTLCSMWFFDKVISDMVR